MTELNEASTKAAYLDVLRVREARVLIAASGSSQIGDWLYNAALLAYVYIARAGAVFDHLADAVRKRARGGRS